MTKRIEQIEQMVGVPIGESGTPQRPFKNALQEKGLAFRDVSTIRGGRTGVRVLFNSLNLRQANQNPTSTLKDEFYRVIANEVVTARHFGDGPYAGKYSSTGLVEDVSTNMGSLGIPMSRYQVSRSIGNMRVDLAYHYQEEGDENFTSFFNRLAEDYLTANAVLLPPKERGKAVVDLREQWDRKSPATFYRLMYQLMGNSQASRSISSFVPYEAEAMLKFYEDRTKKGSIPSDYDMRVFALRSYQDLFDFTKEVKNESGIKIKDTNLYIHRNALVYGLPVIPNG